MTIEASLRTHGVQYTYETEKFNYYKRVYQGQCHACCSTEVYKEAWYTPDFFLKCGTILETKGKFTAADRTKMLAIRELHPNVDIRLVFMRNNKLSKSSNTRYSDWATKHGYLYSIGTTLPPSWIEEFTK